VTDLAFPEAEGFGRHATGGRTGKVYHVTNTNDSGAGSFRDAVSAANRIVVFDVGGYITLKTAVSAKSNLTIAGQTAPGGGIGFRGGELSFANSSNVICRHVRIRPGSETASDTDDALSLFRARNVILDHSSFEFAPWNNIDGVSDDWQNTPVTEITFQDSMIANPNGTAVRRAHGIGRESVVLVSQRVRQFAQPEPACQGRHRVRQQCALQLLGGLHHAHEH
jgi:pectate lyase